MKKVLSLLLAMCMVFALAACGGSGDSSSSTTPPPSGSSDSTPSDTGSTNDTAPASNLDNTAQYVVGTGGTGGTYNAVGALMAQFFNDKGFGQFSATATTGGVQNTLFMRNGTCDFGMVGRSCFVESSTGRNTFESTGPSDDLMAVAPLYSAIFQQFVSPDVAEFDDLKGKSIGVGGPGSGDEAFAHVFYEGVCGWEFDKDFTPAYLGSSEAADAMKDGHIQGMVVLAQAPFSIMIEVVNAGKAHVVGVPQAYIDGVCDKGDDPYASYVPDVIPANTFKDQTEELPSFSSPTLLGVSKQVDEELVYEVTKYLWENVDELTPLHAALAGMKIDDVKSITDLPIHPGAMRYYQEVGVL